MENHKVLESVAVGDKNAGSSCGNILDQAGTSEKRSEDLGIEILEDIELYWEDINDRLMISRMVSDSVIKGMVTAVEQEAAEKISAKEMEIADLRKSLQIHKGEGNARVEPLESSEMRNDRKCTSSGRYLSLPIACLEHDKMRESLMGLKDEARELFRMLRKEILDVGVCGSIKWKGSGSELVGLAGVIWDNVSEQCIHVDKTLDRLGRSFETICTQVDDLLQLSESSFCDWQQERDFQGAVESVVMQDSIRSLQEEYEEKLWDESAQVCGTQSVNWLEKLNELSNLRVELHSVLETLSYQEGGQLFTHGSHDMNHHYRETFSNHPTSSHVLREGNGKLEESVTDVPETFDAAQLKHLSNEEMVVYLNTMITKMKRQHESKLQEMTEKYFSLKREYLNQRGSSLPHRKEKEIDLLKKKIPEIISKLDDMLVVKFPAFTESTRSLESLRERVDSLLCENQQLRGELNDNKNEVKILNSQISDAAEKISQHSHVEAMMLEVIGNLNASLEDSHLEVSISEEVSKCVLKQLSGQVKTKTEESSEQLQIMQGIYETIFKGAADSAKTANNFELKDSDLETLLEQALRTVILEGTIQDALGKLKKMYEELLVETNSQISLERESLQKENELRSQIEENEKLRQKVHLLEKWMEDKAKLAIEVSAALDMERKQFVMASQELHVLRENENFQQKLISENNKEMELVKVQLAEALKEIEMHKEEKCYLNQKLDQLIKDLEEADAQRNEALATAKERHDSLLFVETKEKELRAHMEAVIAKVHALSNAITDFEHRVAGDIRNNNARLENFHAQMTSLIKKANILRRTTIIYKQKFERRCSDLQMAEAEVDLLGDEADTYLSLLEKIYIALDHYSPVLQHYPGIMEILKLMRRELSEESAKSL